MPSLTHKISDLVKFGPYLEVIIKPSLLYEESQSSDKKTERDHFQKSINVFALIDTGASGTIIGESVITKLGVKPIGAVYVNTPSSHELRCFQYDIQLVFSHEIFLPSVIVTETPLKGQHIDCLIGRDVLKNAVFNYNGSDNSFTISF